MRSILQDEKACYISGATNNLECHHIYFGTANRKLSEKYGLKVWLMHELHNEPPFGVHHNRELDLRLKRVGQQVFTERYPELDFVKVFGRNYAD